MNSSDEELLKKFAPHDLSIAELSNYMDEAAGEALVDCMPLSKQGVLSTGRQHEVAVVGAFQRALSQKVHAHLWPTSEVRLLCLRKPLND